MAMVKKTPTCWLWQGKLKKSGHGNFPFQGKCMSASRASWIIHRGAIPDDGLYVCHNCPGEDNPSCVNPEHLFLGRALDNLHDAIRKGNKGLQCKLSPSKVRAIRHLYRDGASQQAIADKYGVSQVTVGSVINGRTWKHV